MSPNPHITGCMLQILDILADHKYRGRTCHLAWGCEWIVCIVHNVIVVPLGSEVWGWILPWVDSCSGIYVTGVHLSLAPTLPTKPGHMQEVRMSSFRHEVTGSPLGSQGHSWGHRGQLVLGWLGLHSVNLLCITSCQLMGEWGCIVISCMVSTWYAYTHVSVMMDSHVIIGLIGYIE